MREEAILWEERPHLKDPLLIAGFDGWGNALGISTAMVSYLIRKMKGRSFAKINPEPFYRYDEHRPVVRIEDGVLKRLTPPGGSFYVVQGGSVAARDLIVLKANEPDLCWSHFVQALAGLCKELGIGSIITIGGMYDNVLHSDRIISSIVSDKEIFAEFTEKGVHPISYEGPGSIHSTLHSEAQKQGLKCISLWCHCPYYLEGSTHFGLLYHLGGLLSSLVGFEIDMGEMGAKWKQLNKQIEGLIENNPELDAMITELRKAKVRGSWANLKKTLNEDRKVVHLKDFFRTR
ncbi:MAG: PAC2 family protein [Desulfatiglans sp.]|jgi:proteasome assembly chaperone (PAC2) family protein|nr:PAC2 family protein [Thermodesulfobacteriota bacterium]MEE4352033.1 PAC2 family protein [Desulfatiglans sp.]